MPPRPRPLAEEPPNIRDRDWRIQAITTLAKPYVTPAGITYPEGTAIETLAFLKLAKRTHNMGLPSPVALYLSAATDAELQGRKRLRRALRGIEDSRDETSGRLRRRESILFDGLQNRAAATVFAYSAIEAFANDSIPPDFAIERLDERTGANESWAVERIERRMSLAEKLDSVLPKANGLPSPKPTRAWAGFKWLQGMRDRLIHLKSKDWRGVGPDDASKWIWGHLLKEQSRFAPWYARNIIFHFVQSDPPRWLSRYSRDFRKEFE